MTIDRTDNNVPAVQQQAKAPVALSRPLSDIDQAWRMAQALAQSSLLPDALRGKTADVLTMILYGQDLGLSPMQSIQGIYVVKGKPLLSAQTWIALARQHGHNPFVACKHCPAPPEQHTDRSANGHQYDADHDPTRCTFTVIRSNGARHTETFTIEDAQRAKLATKDVWQQYPKRMLLARAATDCCRVICPEIAMGFGVEGEYEEPSKVAPEQALAQAVDARTEPGPAPAPADVHDAEVVDDPADLAAADEQARQEVMQLAAEHTAPADDNPLHYDADEIAEGTQ